MYVVGVCPRLGLSRAALVLCLLGGGAALGLARLPSGHAHPADVYTGMALGAAAAAYLVSWEIEKKQIKMMSEVSCLQPIISMNTPDIIHGLLRLSAII